MSANYKVTLLENQQDVMEGSEVTFELQDVMDVGRNVQVLDLGHVGVGDPNISQEVEVVTLEASSSTERHDHFLTASSQKISGRPISKPSSLNLHHHNLLPRGKSAAPALLRNSRRFHTSEQIQAPYVGGPVSMVNNKNTSENVSNVVKQQPMSSTTSQSAVPSLNQNYQHAVLLDENGQPTNEVVVLAPNGSGEYNIVERAVKNSDEVEFVGESGNSKVEENVFQQHGQTIIICQDGESNQYQQFQEDEEGNLIPIESALPFNLDEGTIYFDESTYDASTSNFFITEPVRTPKSKKKSSKKPLQVIIGPDGKPVKKKGQTELKCMEKGCVMTCYNVAELRKHLYISHGFSFDEEVVHFMSDKDFKSWRETYERERMVSFIYRGGTKKVAKDQAVTYLICHRSGHYKPTMSNESLRKRRLKPQGSCKMGGYCTAGIKLVKNTESGVVKMEICHTHYGHPLDSDAIPHLRVTPTLRKVILTKFKEGLTFTEVLAYIHHNPDRLEGLRLVDRRAVRNIYDTWKHPTRRSKQVQKDIDELGEEESPQSVKQQAIHENMSDSQLQLHEHEQPNLNPEPETEISLDPLEQEEKKHIPKANLSSKSGKKKQNTVKEDDGPPTLVPVDLEELREISEHKRVTRSKVKLGIPVLQLNEPQIPDKKLSFSAKSSYGLRPNRKVEVYKTTQPPPKKRTRASSESEQQPDDETSCELKGKKAKNMKRTGPEKRRPEPKKILKVEIESSSESEEEEELPPPPMIISESLEQAIDKLLAHGDSGPTVLLYKPLGGATKYGDTKRELRKDDFCVVLQTPVQRQLFLMFPNIIGFDVIEAAKAPQHHLKLAFIMVLDEYREPIPVAWLLTNSLDSRILTCFFKALKRECGEVKAKYLMTPRLSEAGKMWSSVFEESPLIVQNDIEVRRDLKTLVWREFSTDRGRREVWELVESLVVERVPENLDISNLEEKFEPLLDKLPHSGEFIEKLEKDWLSRVKEWAMCFRYGSSINIMGVSNAFNKLRKFIHFKGTKNLNQNFEHILKIGYDKCFLRSKRMYKGDQKFSQFLDEITVRHLKARSLKDASIVSSSVALNTWVVSESENTNYVVSAVNSPCECKIVCKYCKVCVHMYTCTCPQFLTTLAMCEHIHLAHCDRHQVVDEPELITGDIPMDDEANSAFGKIETSGTEENPGAVINIEAVLKAAGLFHRSDGLQPDQIVSITDADTHTVIYEHTPVNITEEYVSASDDAEIQEATAQIEELPQDQEQGNHAEIVNVPNEQ